MVPTRDTSTAPLAATPKLRGPVTGATTICMGRKGAQTGLGKGGNVRPRPLAPFPPPPPVCLSAAFRCTRRHGCARDHTG